MQHRGRAVVFENIEDYHTRIDDPALDIDEACVMVLKNVGPVGYPGMPEVGNMALPKKLLEKGVTDMVRISDGRMSGTAYGTVVLHVSPESAVGGTLALVRNGDWIELDVEGRRLHLDVTDAELNERRAGVETCSSCGRPGLCSTVYTPRAAGGQRRRSRLPHRRFGFGSKQGFALKIGVS